MQQSILTQRLLALGYPSASAFMDNDVAHLNALAIWLENFHLRQLPMDARGPLRDGAPSALNEYLKELGASTEMLAALEAADYSRVSAWLLSLALQYEYADNREKYEASSSSELLAADEPELLKLSAHFGVTPRDSAVATLQEILKSARQRPRPPTRAPAPAPKRPASAIGPEGTADATVEAVEASLAGVRRVRPALAGLEAFPLGFDTGGSAALDAAARVLRMLHVRELRRLQDQVNAAIVTMQEFTANPKTDAKLGRVGR